MTVTATPDLAEIIQLAIESAQFELHTACPGQITAIYYDEANKSQSVDVRPCLRRVLPVDPSSGSTLEPYAEEELPVIRRVPLAYPQGAWFSITWPMSVGDFVLLVFAERSIDQWLHTASKAVQSTISTGDLGMHTLDGAIALPLGPAPYGSLLKQVSVNALSLGSEEGKRIHVTHFGIALGSVAPFYSVALGEKVLTELEKVSGDIGTLKDATSVAIAALETAISGAAGTITSTFNASVASIPRAPSSVASSVVKTD